jgi:S-adenosylmethionine decarboxylase
MASISTCTLLVPICAFRPQQPPDVDLPETKTHFVNHPQRLLREQPTDKEEDETLEVLITDLDEKNARQFYLKDASAVAEG